MHGMKRRSNHGLIKTGLSIILEPIDWLVFDGCSDTYELLHEETDCSLLKEILEKTLAALLHIKKKTAGHGIK